MAAPGSADGEGRTMKRHWLLAAVLVPLAAGCAHTGRLTYVPLTIAPTKTHVAGQPPTGREEAAR